MLLQPSISINLKNTYLCMRMENGIDISGIKTRYNIN